MTTPSANSQKQNNNRNFYYYDWEAGGWRLEAKSLFTKGLNFEKCDKTDTAKKLKLVLNLGIYEIKNSKNVWRVCQAGILYTPDTTKGLKPRNFNPRAVFLLRYFIML